MSKDDLRKPKAIINTELDVRSALRARQQNTSNKKLQDIKQPNTIQRKKETTTPTSILSETAMYNKEKLNAFKEIVATIPVFLKHGVKTNKHLREIEDKQEEKAADQLIDPNFYEGEVGYESEFEEEVRNFGGIKMTYRKLYSHLIVYIEDKLRNTEEGKQLCFENVVKTSKDYARFDNIIFSIIKALLENAPINEKNILKTASYLNVPEINVKGVCSRASFSKVTLFAERIMITFFSSQKEMEKIQNNNDAYAGFDIIGNKDQQSKSLNELNNSQTKQVYINIYQEFFLNYKGDVTNTENLKDYQKIACAWYCLICRYYTKTILTDKDWQDLEKFLDSIKEALLNTASDNLIEIAITNGFDEEFVRLIISIEDFQNLFVNYVFDNLEKTIVDQKDKMLSSSKDIHLK